MWFSWLGFSEFLGYVGLYHFQIWGDFSHYFFKYFLNLPLFSSLSGSPVTGMPGLLLYSHRFLRLYSCIFILFSPSCSYCVIYSVLFSHSSISFSVPSHFLLVPFMEVLKIIIIIIINLIIISFSLKLPIWYYFISFISLLIISNFCCFKYLHNCSLKHFYHDCFNFLTSLSSQVLHILIVLFHFLIWFEISLGLGMTNDFNWNLDIFMLCHADTGSYLKLLF